MKLKPYPEYKDSGVPWLGKIPSHWDSQRLKYLAQINPTITKATQKPATASFVPMARVRANYPWFTAEERQYSEIEKGFTYFCDGDVLVAKITPCFENGKGGICRSLANGIGFGSTEFHVVRTGESIINTFLYYLSIARSFRHLGEENMQGSAGQKRVPTEFIKNLRVAYPDTEEQTQIAKFLDWKTAQINKFIRNKRRLIELLKEQKQNIINQAVTRGLDPNVKLKPSGVEWIGDIPEHWEVLPLRRCTKLVKTGGTPTGAGDEYFTIPGFNWFTPSDFKEDLYLTDSERQLSESGKNSVKLFPPNTVMMIGIGGTIGKVSISRNQASCNQQINGILPNKRVNTEYLAFTLRCLRNFIVSCGNFTTMPIINQDETKSLQIPVPPISEQTDIVQSIDVGSLVINQAITRAENEIEQMREYRTRLISDVVTGQVDVRDIEVPEVTEEDLLTMEDNSEVLDDDLVQEEDE